MCEDVGQSSERWETQQWFQLQRKVIISPTSSHQVLIIPLLGVISAHNHAVFFKAGLISGSHLGNCKCYGITCTTVVSCLEATFPSSSHRLVLMSSFSVLLVLLPLMCAEPWMHGGWYKSDLYLIVTYSQHFHQFIKLFIHDYPHQKESTLIQVKSSTNIWI